MLPYVYELESDYPISMRELKTEIDKQKIQCEYRTVLLYTKYYNGDEDMVSYNDIVIDDKCIGITDEDERTERGLGRAIFKEGIICESYKS
jgi:hypothetical protein